MSASVSIIIPAFNQLDFCRQCITSILKHTEPPYRLILVDNGSTDGVGEYFDSVPDAVVVHAGENRGFAGGVNLGLERAEGHALLLNSDTIVPQGWLKRLETALLSAGDIGMVGPRSNCVSGGQQIDGLNFPDVAALNVFAEQRAAQFRGMVRDVARLVGFCVLIRDTALEQVGHFDESYGIGNYEDDDYCVRLLRAGWRLCVAEDSFVFHYGGRTFVGMGLVEDAWRGLMEQNRKRFEEKWTLRPEETNDALRQALQWGRQAEEAIGRGDLREAFALLKEAVTLAPNEAVLYNDLGVATWQSGDAQRALTYFRRALQCDPAYAAARENVAKAAEALGLPPEAPAQE